MSQEEILSEQLLDFIGEHEDIELYKDMSTAIEKVLLKDDEIDGYVAMCAMAKIIAVFIRYCRANQQHDGELLNATDLLELFKIITGCYITLQDDAAASKVAELN